MKVVVLYHPKSDHGGQVEDYAYEFERYKHKKIDLLSVESTDGAEMAALYGITQYPAYLVKSDDGSLLRLWQSTPPLMDELSYYVHNEQTPISAIGHKIIFHPA